MASDISAPGEPAPFEATLAQLEQLVAQLESGDLPLDQALRSFEQGVRLTRECQSALCTAQQKETPVPTTRTEHYPDFYTLYISTNSVLSIWERSCLRRKWVRLDPSCRIQGERGPYFEYLIATW